MNLTTGFPNPISLVLVLGLFSLLPLLVVMCTSFLKIAVVMMLVRNALGVQQIPPNIALYGLSLILSVYVMAPAAQQIYIALQSTPQALETVTGTLEALSIGSGPLREFLARNALPEQQAFFVETARSLWPPNLAKALNNRDFLVLIPSFVVSELTAAFKIGFLLYLPFVVIDLVVQNILLALGMMMMSPMTISLPLKLLLFVMADGWSRLLQGLVLSYS